MYSTLVDLSPVFAEQSADSLLARTLARARARALTVSGDRTEVRADPLQSAPELLRNDLWRSHQLNRQSWPAITASGFPTLDAELPGGGWPHRALTELLVPHPGLGELRLLVPALSRIAGAGDADESIGRCVMLFDPPAALCGWALAQLGVDAQQLFVVYGREGARGAAHLRRVLPSADLLWALEQSLKSGHVGAVLAWLPQRLRADALRRLQLAAQVHEGPVFLFREVEARSKPSASPLRLLLQGAGIDRLSVRVFKRRGPPLAQPLVLALPPVLSERLRARAESRAVPAAPAVARPVLDPVQNEKASS